MAQCILIQKVKCFWMMDNILTRSSNMSLWWTWMVMRVSYLVLSTASRSLVVMSISVLSRSRKSWLVLAIMRRSYRALVRASSESLVHIIWIPSKPTWIKNNNVCPSHQCVMIKCIEELNCIVPPWILYHSWEHGKWVTNNKVNLPDSLS